MKDLLDKTYDLFSQRLSKWFIFAGIVCFGLEIFISFLDDMIAMPEEALNAFIVLAFFGLILAGIVFGHYKDKEPLLVVAFIGFLFTRLYSGIVSDSWGASFLGQAGAPYVLHWLFNLFFDLAFAAFLVFAFFVYLLKFRRMKLALEISFVATLFFGFLAWIFDIVYAANGFGWSFGVLPLFHLGSLLMIPGLLEELLPGELETPREETAE